MHNNASDHVIVGIDGSHAARSAALWGAQEAASRGGQLRLIYVVDSELVSPMPSEAYRVQLDKGKAALTAARNDVLACVPALKVTTDVFQGDPAGVLLAESRFASMICVGSNGIGRFARAFLGSTAEIVANHAACSVAVIRSAETAQSVNYQPQFVIAPVTVFADNSTIIEAAVSRARHHHSPVLALGVKDNDLGATPREVLDEMVEQWRQAYPDVRCNSVATTAGGDSFVRHHPEISTIVELNPAVQQDISALVGRIRRPLTAIEQLVVILEREHVETAPSAPDATSARG